MEYVLAVVVVAFVGTSVWAGLGWWELNQAGSVEAQSAFRSAVRESERTGGLGWGNSPSVKVATPKSVSQGGMPLPSLDMMLQGTTRAVQGSTGGQVPAAPSIDKGFDQINDVLQGR